MSGPSVMMCYYNNPEETDKIKVVDENGTEWIKSGDLGYMAEDGNLFIQGRIKRIIIRYDGFKVFPSMIESILIKHPAVEEVCVVKVKDKEHVQGELPAVYVVFDHTYGTEEKAIEELSLLCKKELPEYVQPSEWHFIDKMPLTPIGKVDYRKLEEMAAKSDKSCLQN